MAVQAIPPALARRCYETAAASKWGIALEPFVERLAASVKSRFASEVPAARELDAYLDGLHLQDLALACACAAGHEAAWDHFVREMRPALYAAARAVARGDDARDLADSLYAQLFGVDARGERRRSLLDYYHGRAKLSTWLRSVLAQRHVDSLRERARTVPLETANLPEPAASDSADPDAAANTSRVQDALNGAIAAMDDRDRLRLRLYYGQRLTLAKIGRALGEHEATASRHLERARRTLRQQIEARLRAEHGMTAEAVRVCMQQAAEAPDLDLSHVLVADDS